MLLAEHDEVVQALVLQGLDEPLHKRVRIRRPVTRLLDLQVRRREDLIERRRELGVTIPHDDRRGQLCLFDMSEKPLRLLFHPGLRLGGTWMAR